MNVSFNGHYRFSQILPGMRQWLFFLVNGNKPELMIEAKRSGPHPDRSRLFFSKRYHIPSGQIVLHLMQEKKEKEIETRRRSSCLNSLQKMGGNG